MSRMTGCSVSIGVRSITLCGLTARTFLLVFQLAAPANSTLFVDDQLLADHLVFTNKEAPVADWAYADIVKANAVAETGPAEFSTARERCAVTQEFAAATDSQQPRVRPVGAARFSVWAWA